MPNFTSINPQEGDRSIPRLLVTVGEVTIDDSNGLYIANPEPASMFTDYIINQKYEQDRHVYMMPIASPNGFAGGSAAFVQLAAPTLLRIVDLTAARLNRQPILPDPTSVDPSWILLDEHIEPAMLTVAIDGVTPLYRCSATYVYGKTNPADNAFQDIAFARPPWLKEGFTFGRDFPNSSLQGGLLEPNGITGGTDGSVGTGAGGSFGGGTGGGTTGGGGGSVGGGGEGSIGGGGG